MEKIRDIKSVECVNGFSVDYEKGNLTRPKIEQAKITVQVCKKRFGGCKVNCPIWALTLPRRE